MKRFYFFFCLLFASFTLLAQNGNEDTAYIKVVTQRADKIVKTLGLADDVSATRVRDLVAGQYRHLNGIHGERDRQLKVAREQYAGNAPGLEEAKRKIEEEATRKLEARHQSYLASLSAELSKEQVEKVKDGMTYGVLPITYKGYLEMIPSLTEEQKKQIMTWLTEAREKAMDAESSEKKHQWFGKYKGKINNYLSAAGYDLKKEGQEWEKRRMAAMPK